MLSFESPTAVVLWSPRVGRTADVKAREWVVAGIGQGGFRRVGRPASNQEDYEGKNQSIVEGSGRCFS
jgi:hypothetical protein